jgi:hypothetical protein
MTRPPFFTVPHFFPILAVHTAIAIAHFHCKSWTKSETSRTKMSRSSALATAITDLLRDLPEELSHLPAVLKEIGYRVVLPTGVALFVILVGGQWLYEIYKILFPPPPEEYHK